MGSLILVNHWERIILASVREFLGAEDLAAALETGHDAGAARNAAYEALRRSMVATIFLHHFAEVAANRQHPALHGLGKLAIYKELAARTLAPDQSPRPDDVKILGEVADAIKHGELNANHIRHVARNGRVIEWTHEAASLFAEGSANGAPQIIVATAAGSRSLRAVLHKVSTTWSNWLGLAQI
ncbi:hypothetical protein FBZ98_11531 [Rhizobium sp. ERR 922]|uniref:hypothetical protein n=1 Tax=unclassified Rhizobium TaxID=2613769 RepID=UPI0011A557FE|nr:MULTISPECIES: hypothetical protein [unclassified Rhizobium]TWB45561.1 hypothetical protein FBZ98_11531 [Rhizobium sp. ERR 922]TWB88204.1 hypothetical protein FBZ97_11427 [Rhizobium sp. ERR 942]